MRFLKIIISSILLLPIFVGNISAQFNPYSVVNKLPGLNIVSRSEWGCPDLNPDSRSYCYGPEWSTFRNPISHIVIHHTATTNNASDWAAQVRAVWNLHAIKNDWTDIGYNYLIDPNGIIYEGKYGGEGATAGHTYLHNIGTVGIALLGDYDSRSLNSQTYESLKNLLTTLFIRYKINPEEVTLDFTGGTNPRLSAHRDWHSTECPGDNLYPYMAQLRKDISYELKKHNSQLNWGNCPNGFISKDNSCIAYAANLYSSYLGTVHRIFIADDYIYTYSPESNNLSKINSLDSTDSKLISQYTPTTTAMLKHPNGKIYGTQADKNQLIEISETDGSFKAVASVGNYPKDMAVNSDGAIYVVNSNSNDIYQVNANGTSSKFADTEDYPISIAIDSKDNLYVANYMSDSVTKITSSGVKTNYNILGILPRDLVIDSQDNVYVLNEGTGNITMISVSGEVSNYIELDDQSISMAIDSQNNIYVINYNSDAVSIVSNNKKITKVNNWGSKLIDIQINSKNEVFAASTSGELYRLNYTQNSIQSTAPVYRFWSTAYGSHFFTASQSEMSEVMSKYTRSIWDYENVAFKVFNNQIGEGLMPVYRFWSGKYQTHFYTINEVEKNEIMQKFDETTWKYEGISYYTFINPTENSKPVYRFWSPKLASHFYTISEVEKNEIILKTSSTWNFEGVAWYAYE